MATKTPDSSEEEEITRIGNDKTTPPSWPEFEFLYRKVQRLERRQERLWTTSDSHTNSIRGLIGFLVFSIFLMFLFFLMSRGGK